VDDSLDSWFKREIFCHEAALVRYLNRKWPDRDEIHDLRQEVYIRVYEAALRARPTSPKSFLFATARNLMADRVRRGRIVSIEAMWDLDGLNVMVDEISPERRLRAGQELRRLARAFDRLPAKCREVVWMRRVDGLPQKEVAIRLGVTQKTVERHVIKGMRLLTDAILGRRTPERHGRGETSEDESEHGQQQRD
jgi:RNA polymerase sigma factor (sigma-70 family)